MVFYADSRLATDRVSTVRKPGGTFDQVVPLIGRLDGSPSARQELHVHHADSEFAFDAELGPLAYVGRSPRNRPIILTNRGRFEILSADIDLADDIGLAVYNEKIKSVVARYVRPHVMPFVAITPTTIGVWDQRRRLCVSAAQRRPGPLTLMTHRCRRAANGRPDEFELISGQLTPAPEDAIRALDFGRLVTGEAGREAALFTTRNSERTLILVLPSLNP